MSLSLSLYIYIYSIHTYAYHIVSSRPQEMPVRQISALTLSNLRTLHLPAQGERHGRRQPLFSRRVLCYQACLSCVFVCFVFAPCAFCDLGVRSISLTELIIKQRNNQTSNNSNNNNSNVVLQ